MPGTSQKREVLNTPWYKWIENTPLGRTILAALSWEESGYGIPRRDVDKADVDKFSDRNQKIWADVIAWKWAELTKDAIIYAKEQPNTKEDKYYQMVMYSAIAALLHPHLLNQDFMTLIARHARLSLEASNEVNPLPDVKMQPEDPAQLWVS